MKKITVKYRKVYYKNVEVTLDMPDSVDDYNVQQYLNSEESLNLDEQLFDELNKIPYSEGNGIDSDDSWTDLEETEETRYELTSEDGKYITGGHL
jgi:hypothetical protein